MTAHVHAEAMALYAQDAAETDKPWERWERNLKDLDIWYGLSTHPTWLRTCTYRRKPSHFYPTRKSCDE